MTQVDELLLTALQQIAAELAAIRSLLELLATPARQEEETEMCPHPTEQRLQMGATGWRCQRCQYEHR